VLPAVLAAIGLAWGLVADRIGARWPEHDDGSTRRVDWRTPLVALIAAGAFYGLAARFDGVGLAVLVAFAAVLVVLLATDLDQRLLPDLLTLPLVPFAAAVDLLGWNPLVGPSQLPFAIGTAIAIPALLLVLSIPFGQDAIGMGDIKLLVSVGLLLGPAPAIAGLVAGALLSGVVVVALLASRRVTLRTYIPFGPFLIVGALWGIIGAR
jgi:prepilin signal peptidase PulO-like enzyme (type II secretory pathway)